MNRTGWIVAIAVSFIVGSSLGLAGGVMISRFAPHGMSEPRRPGERGGPGGPRERQSLLERLAVRLELTPAQRERIEVLMSDARLEHGVVRDSMNAKIERELTPEQRVEWKKIQSEFPRSRRGGGPPPPPDQGRP